MKHDETECTVDTFELLNVVPVTDMFAVYAVPHPTQHGKFCLEKSPIHFIGVAKVTEITYRLCDVISKKRVDNRIVGVDLADGYFTVCDEANNFAGLMKDGDQIDSITGCLVAQYLDHLVK